MMNGEQITFVEEKVNLMSMKPNGRRTWTKMK